MSVHSMDGSATGVTVWRVSWGLALVALGVGVLSVWPFWDGLSYMWGSWIDLPEYSHGPLIPPIAAFLVYQQKDRLERMTFSGSWWGVALLVLGGALLVLGQLGTVYVIVQYAYLVSLYGLVLAFLGWPAARLIAVPLLILLFMIPLPAFFLNTLSLQLQLLSSELGVWMMQLFGISAYREGNIIDLGSYRLQVADACSGLRYLFPLMTLGFLIAYFYKGALWKRGVIFLSSIPITLLMNSARVASIGVMVEHWGTGAAEGFLHEFHGWAVFMVCTALLLGEGMLLNVFGRERGTWRQLFSVELPAPTPAGAKVRRRRVPKSFIAAAVLLCTFLLVAFAVPRPTDTPPERARFTDFPMHLGDWQGRAEPMDKVYIDELQLDDYLLANYVRQADVPVNLYMAYYATQRKGGSVHSPRSCLPGGGWQMKEFGTRELPRIAIAGHPLRVNRVLIEQGNERELVYYWFQERGRGINSEYAVKWYLFIDALTRHRTDGALVRLITQLPLGGSLEEADRRLTDLMVQVAPELSHYVPD